MIKVKRVTFRTAFACLMLLLVGCANNGQSGYSARSSLKALTGEPVQEATAYGFVTRISVEERIITIKHAPIPEMNWAPMIMPFNVADDIDLSPFQRGDKVDFVLEIDKEKNYRIKRMSVAL